MKQQQYSEYGFEMSRNLDVAAINMINFAIKINQLTVERVHGNGKENHVIIISKNNSGRNNWNGQILL